jgi:SAM-dependent methyltransferase
MSEPKYNLSRLERVIYNHGERMLPGLTHSMAELQRHRSSYEFFASAIEADLKRKPLAPGATVTIVDLGFGTGHGCHLLSRIPGSRVIGIDNSPACQRYALRHYNAPNIEYVIADIPEYLASMQAIDYVVSRGVIEHVRNGIEECLKAKWTARLMIDVPYNEPYDINEHHVVSEVTAKDFANYPNAEIFYEEVSGNIYTGDVQDPAPNMIMCVSSAPGYPPLSSLISLPRAAWNSDRRYESFAPKTPFMDHVRDFLNPLDK